MGAQPEGWGAQLEAQDDQNLWVGHMLTRRHVSQAGVTQVLTMGFEPSNDSLETLAVPQ